MWWEQDKYTSCDPVSCDWPSVTNSTLLERRQSVGTSKWIVRDTVKSIQYDLEKINVREGLLYLSGGFAFDSRFPENSGITDEESLRNRRFLRNGGGGTAK